MTIAYHEPPESLRAETREIHRGLASLIEELEAMDWYQHRIDASGDADLCAILKHHQHEEMEHAAMTLEWLRRRMPELDAHLREYLFKETPIVEEDEAGGEADSAAQDRDSSLGIGRGSIAAQ